MTAVTVVYHHEGSDWWAESDDLPGLSVLGADFAETKRLLQDALAEYFEDPSSVQVLARLEDGALLVDDSPLRFTAGAVGVSSSADESVAGQVTSFGPRQLVGTR